MPLENVLQRLARSRSFQGKEAVQRKILKRIHPPLFQSLRSATSLRDPLRLRGSILARISHPITSQRFLTLQESLSPSLDLLLLLKERILHRIAIPHPTPRFFGVLRFAAVTALLALVMRIMPIFFIATPLQATAENLLIPTEGFVSITRGAEWGRVDARMGLTEPLTIRTGPESSATIVLGDTVVLRLGENTEVNLRPAAFSVPGEAREPIARVIYGQLWVTSLLPETLEPETAIVLPQGTLALRQGSVSVLADPQQSTIPVFHSFAEITPTGGSPLHLIEGDQLTLFADGSAQHNLITKQMREDDWVQTNRARDAAHRIAVTERQQELAKAAAGILPTSTFYSLKRVSEELDLFWTFGRVARQEKRVQHAQTRFNEAVALLSKGERKAAENPLSEYREAIRELATLTEEEARELLTSSFITSSTTVASALPHSPLYEMKKTLAETASEFPSAELSADEVSLYLLSDALLGIEGLVAQGNIEEASSAFSGIEGAVVSVLSRQELEETKVGKDSLKAVKTILRSIAVSLRDAKENFSPELASTLEDLQLRIAGKLPPEALPAAIAAAGKGEVCMSLREVTRRTNQFLASVYTYETPRGQRNAVLQQIALLPDCAQSGRILSKVMNKVPVFTRSFVWEALQKIGAGT